MTRIAAYVLSMFDNQWVETQRERADIMNTPSFGHSSARGLVNSGQVNLSGAQKPGNAHLLKESLGTAGDAHIDSHDDKYSMTVIIPFGHLPGCHPGLFFLMEIGIYFVMDNYTAVVFSGLRMHGGNSPRPCILHNWEEFLTRLVYIAYANVGLAQRENVLSLAGQPKGGAIEVDVTQADEILACGRTPPEINTLSYASDGLSLMEPDELARFLSREMLLLARSIIRQTPSSLGMKIDPKAFLSAFSYLDHEHKDDDGNPTRMQVPPWLNAPGISQEVDAHRSSILSTVQSDALKISLSMPSQLNQHDVKKYLDEHPNCFGSLEENEAAFLSIINENSSKRPMPSDIDDNDAHVRDVEPSSSRVTRSMSKRKSQLYQY